MNPDRSPNLLSGSAPRTDIQLASADTDARLQAVPSDWGIYRNNEKIIEPDSIVAFDYRRDWAVADFPLEQGAFTSYDKVAKPFDIRLRMTKGGSDIDRQTFLAAIENLGAGLTLYDVVTPDRLYLSVTITSLGYARTATNGVSLLTVDVGVREIRETASAGLSNTIDPGSADTHQGGLVQAQPVSASTQAEILAAVRKRQAEIDGTMFNIPAY